MSYEPQTDMFGNLSYNVEVLPTARRIMTERPVTYRSHRLLMLELAKDLGCTWVQRLNSEEQQQLEILLDLSPDFERSARKVREEDAERQRQASLVGASDN